MVAISFLTAAMSSLVAISFLTAAISSLVAISFLTAAMSSLVAVLDRAEETAVWTCCPMISTKAFA